MTRAVPEQCSGDSPAVRERHSVPEWGPVLHQALQGCALATSFIHPHGELRMELVQRMGVEPMTFRGLARTLFS